MHRIHVWLVIAALGQSSCSSAGPPVPPTPGAPRSAGAPAITSGPVIATTPAAGSGATGVAVGPDEFAPAPEPQDAGRPPAPDTPTPDLPATPAPDAPATPPPTPTLPMDPAVIDWQPGGECPKNLSCGSTMCSTETINPTGIGASQNLCTPACCTAQNTCGIRVLTSMTDNADSTCTELEQIGVATEECGAAEEMVGDMGVPLDPSGLLNFPVVGCCRPDSRCGLFLPNLGAGCVALEEIKNITPLFELIDIPPVPCTYPTKTPKPPG